MTETLLGLMPGTTYHVRLRASNALGSPAGSDTTFTTLAEPAPPRLSGFRFAPARFREHSPRSHRRGRRKPLPTGTHIRFTLSSTASVQISFSRALSGRRRHGACVAPVKGRIPRRSRCILYVARGGLSLGTLGPGPHAIAFRGRVGKTTLAPGTYRATIVATGSQTSRRSKTLSATFTIVR